LANQRGIAAVADKAVAVPVTVFKRDELGSSKTSDRFGATAAFLSKQIAKTFSTVRFILSGSEFFARQNLVAVGTLKAVTVKCYALVGDSTFVDHAIALGTALCVLIFVALHADNGLLARDEALVSNGLGTHLATEALLMPLLSLVLKLLHTSSEDVLAPITPSSKVVVMAVGAVQLLLLGCKWLVHQGRLTVAAFEATFMPMFLLV